MGSRRAGSAAAQAGHGLREFLAGDGYGAGFANREARREVRQPDGVAERRSRRQRHGQRGQGGIAGACYVVDFARETRKVLLRRRRPQQPRRSC